MTAKQIRLKDRVIKVESPAGKCPRTPRGCPCYDSDYDVCTLTNARDFDHCPLEDYVEPANKIVIDVPENTSYEVSHKVNDWMGSVDRFIKAPAKITIEEYAAPANYLEKPDSSAKPEPELMICGRRAKGHPCIYCVWSIPHKRGQTCDDGHGCGLFGKVKCIPYTKPATPEQNTICSATILSGSCPACPQYLTCAHPGKKIIDPLLLSQLTPIRAAISKHAEEIYTLQTKLAALEEKAGMAADIGTLTIRVDNLQTEVELLRKGGNACQK